MFIGANGNPPRMPEREFQLWKALNRFYPITDDVWEYRFGVLASIILDDGSEPWEHFPPAHHPLQRERWEALARQVQEKRKKAAEKAARRAANQPK